MPSARRTLGLFGALWGWLGVTLLFAKAIHRMAPAALDLFSLPLTPRHWAALLGSVSAMAYVKGYWLFQGRFSPRVASRARHLREHPRLSRVLLAPLFCMGFFHAPPLRVAASWSVTAAIILLVVLIRGVSQPWRGIVYCGVVTGLGWGVASLAFFTFDALVRDAAHCEPEVPD